MSTPLLSAKLIELRQYFNLSQQEVADYLGLTREAYSHYERAAREPSLETLVKLSKLYEIDISELINEQTILSSETLAMEIRTEKCILNDKHLFHLTRPSITKNLIHLLKLLSGKNSNLDVTNITKEDIDVLIQYKSLSNHAQKEVRQFIKFKLSLSTKKE